SARPGREESRPSEKGVIPRRADGEEPLKRPLTQDHGWGPSLRLGMTAALHNANLRGAIKPRCHPESRRRRGTSRTQLGSHKLACVIDALRGGPSLTLGMTGSL